MEGHKYKFGQEVYVCKWANRNIYEKCPCCNKQTIKETIQSYSPEKMVISEVTYSYLGAQWVLVGYGYEQKCLEKDIYESFEACEEVCKRRLAKFNK